MAGVKRGRRIAATGLAAMLAFAAGAAQAQTGDMKLLRGPVYGEMRDILGATLPVATPSPKCPQAAQLPDGACLDKVLADMKARGATGARVLTVPGPGPNAAPGQVIAGPFGAAYRLYDVSLKGGAPVVEPLTLPASSVRVPRACFATGDGVGYRLEVRGGLLTALEAQPASCGGSVPPLGLGRRGPPIHPDEPGERWPATATLAVAGAPRQLAAPRPDCPPEAALRDGLCFAAGIAQLAARPDLKALDVIGAKRPVRPGDILVEKDSEQYVLKRKGKAGFKADKRWFDRSNLTAPAGCSMFGAGDFEVEQPGPLGEAVHERAKAGCGAPAAPEPRAIYEAYGATMPVVFGNRPGCAEQGLQLLGDACFDRVIGYMRARGIGKGEALVLDRPYPVGTRVHSNGDIRFSFADVWAEGDGKNRADRKRSYTPKIRSGVCTTVTDDGPEASGVVLVHADGGVMAQAYQWVACPVR